MKPISQKTGADGLMMTQKNWSRFWPKSKKIDDDFWAVIKTADDDSKKTGGHSGSTGPSPRLGGGPEMRPDSVESLINPYVS